MTEPTASPDVTGLIERLRRGVPYWTPPGRTLDSPNVSAGDALMKAAADALLALRQEIEAAEASLRLATQRREDVTDEMVEAAVAELAKWFSSSDRSAEKVGGIFRQSEDGPIAVARYADAQEFHAAFARRRMRAALEVALALHSKET